MLVFGVFGIKNEKRQAQRSKRRQLIVRQQTSAADGPIENYADHLPAC